TMQSIPDFNEFELWTVKTTLRERYGRDIDVELAETEVRLYRHTTDIHLFKLLWRRRERLSLIVIGIVLVSLAASLAAVTARSTQGTLDEELA
ncbi:hypothetical protein Q6283_28230, partial [Klebsiella pneumoniae]|uniref:hypothetical protein n=1 Tax=Klebsiella pneumoniae TaxID=573 RepID=UPI002731B5EE